MMFKKRKNEEQIEAIIHDLIMHADRVPAAEATAFNVAGDMLKEAGYTERALSYYGLSIDAFMKAERWDSAAAICRKVLRLAPGTVRARCTLAWLAIGKGTVADAQVEIRAYVSAARRAGRDSLAVAQLKRMGDAAPSPTLRSAVADQLRALGQNGAAEYVYGTLRNDSRVVPGVPEDELLWSTCRRAAMLGPTELGAR
jgi:hypothetical protein